MSRSSLHERAPLAAAIDAGIVTAFVAIGRRNHDEDPGIIGLLETAAPFLVGLFLAWISTRALFDSLSVRTGLRVWPITVAAGMAIRSLTGAGTALSFVIVATVFLGVTLVGWRAASQAITAKRPTT